MKKIQQDILYDSSVIDDDLAACFLSLFKPEDVFKQFKPKGRLNGLDLKIIEEYLHKQRKMGR